MKEFEVEVRGFVEPEFEPLTHIFARAVGAQWGGGAQFAAYHRGRKVVDLVGGDFADDSVMLVFSVSKAIAAVGVQHAVASGALAPDLVLHDVWPEFERSARSRAITLRHVLAHAAGLPTVDPVLSMDDHVAGALERALESQEPYWEPGTVHGYHALTWGALVDGVFRRTLGMGVGDYLATHAFAPLGLDLSLGATEDQLPRLRPHRRPAVAITPLDRRLASDAGAPRDGAGALLWPDMTQFTRQDVVRLPWPSSNAVGSARDLARFFAATIGEVDGARILDDRSLATMTATRYQGIDAVLGFAIAFGAGVQLPFPQFPMFGAGSFGHEGAGGAVAVANQRRGLSAAYVSDRFPTSNGGAIESQSLIAAVGMIADRIDAS